MSDIPKKIDSIEKLSKVSERLAKNLQGNPFLALERIAKDVQEQKDNAIAMEFTKCIGELLRKNGVMTKMTEYTGNFETDKTFETRYGVSIDELDFTAHDKVFEDKIAELKKDYKTVSELLGKYQQENESLKKRIIELEDFSCQAEQETESLVEKLNQRIAELESGKTSELPFDALETANYLINATYERETSSLERAFAKVPDKVNSDRYTIDDLEQIAEHLLVYCKHNKESEE